MFSYLKVFFIVGALVILIVGVGAGIYIRHKASSDIVSIVEKSNVSLSQGFINTTWKKHRTTLEQLVAVDVSKWKDYAEFVAFSQDAFRYFEEIPVAQLNIYNANGELILTTNKSEIVFQNNATNIKSLPQSAEAENGNIVSDVLTDHPIKAADGRLSSGTLVRTLVPIISDSYVEIVAGKSKKAEGIIEVFYDVTPQWNQLIWFQVIGTGSIVMIFTVLISALIFITQKAEMAIARQHEKNLELAATAAAAEAESREKSQFLANVSHELRTPLNAIIGFSEIMKNQMMGVMDNPQYHEYIKDIHGSGVHLLSLINDILDYSKAEAGKLELEVAEADVAKIIINSMRLVSPRAEAGNVKLVEDVPREDLVLVTDAKKFKQVMLNLLSNAVKFTPAGGEVKVHAWKNVFEDTVTIEVKDSGIGIAPKDISRAMAPFGQVDGALNRKYEGTGLGLPLTKKFVELMGGAFSIQSAVGKGTVVSFTLPRVCKKRNVR